MIVCHCRQITDHQIRDAVDWMRAADPATVITPGKVYRALGHRVDCGGCLPLFLAMMAQCDTLGVPLNLRGLARAMIREDNDEGRSESDRIPQLRAAE